MVHEALPDIQLVDIVPPVLRGLDNAQLATVHMAFVKIWERHVAGEELPLGREQFLNRFQFLIDEFGRRPDLERPPGGALDAVLSEFRPELPQEQGTAIAANLPDQVEPQARKGEAMVRHTEAFHIRGTHWVRVPASGRCPAEFPVRAQFPGRQQTVCFTQASARSAAQARQRRSEQAESPTNPVGLTVRQTLEGVGQQGRKSSKAEAKFQQRSPSPERACGTCRFFLRDSASEIGLCQVVEGPIPWFSTSDLFISAEDEAEFSFGAAQP